MDLKTRIEAVSIQLRKELQSIGKFNRSPADISAGIAAALSYLCDRPATDVEFVEMYKEFLPMIASGQKDAVKVRVNDILISMNGYEVLENLIEK